MVRVPPVAKLMISEDRSQEISISLPLRATFNSRDREEAKPSSTSSVFC
jgi:hypothetical protein